MGAQISHPKIDGISEVQISDDFGLLFTWKFYNDSQTPLNVGKPLSSIEAHHMQLSPPIHIVSYLNEFASEIL